MVDISITRWVKMTKLNTVEPPPTLRLLRQNSVLGNRKATGIIATLATAKIDIQ